MPESSQAQPAYVKDYHEEEEVEVGAKTEARRTQRAASRAPVIVDRRREPTPSDSGYSSHRSGTKPTKSVEPVVSQAMVRQAPPTSSAHKAVVQRRDSGRIPTATQPQSQSQCPDPYCRDPNCASTQVAAERRRSMSQAPQQAPSMPPPPPPPPPQQSRPLPQPQQQPRSIPPYPQSAAAQYQQQAHINQSYYYQYPQTASAQMPPPPLPQQAAPQAVPRPRAASMSRPRPLSIHGYPTYGGSYDDSQRGPPPSASAYYPTGPIGYIPSPSDYLASTPPDPTSLGYPPYSPGPTSPTSPIPIGGASGYLGGGNNMYSTRRGNPTITGLVVPKIPPHVIPSRSLSARRSESVQPPTPALQAPESPEYSSGSDGSASDDQDDDDDEQDVHEVPVRRASRTSRPPSQNKEMVLARRKRRPSLGKGHYTTANITSLPQDLRPHEPLRRAPRSDSDFNYYASSDHPDLDRDATRAIVPIRDSSRNSRRHSIFTHTSSDRTQATSVSSRSDPSRVILEDSNGRRTRYLSGNETNQLRRLKSLQKRDALHNLDERERTEMHIEKAVAYQRLFNPGACELTAENVKSANRKSGSHLSGVRTHKSSHSGSRASRANDGGIRIQSGDTVLHVYGDAQIEMRRDEDGGPAHLIVNGGRDSGYNTSSRSTDSRHGRSRIGSEMGRSHRYQRQPIYEEMNEGGYERNL